MKKTMGTKGHFMLSDMQILQVKNQINRILHVPGNYSGGPLEMAIVADYHMPEEELCETCKKIVAMLKKQDDVFRNVRLNLIKWVSDDVIIKEVTPMPFLLMGRAFEDYKEPVTKAEHADAEPEEAVRAKAEPADEGKSLDELFRQLKLFYARSKVILILTDGDFRIDNAKAVQGYLQPFLARKLLLVRGTEIVPGTKLFMEMMINVPAQGVRDV